MQRTAPSGPSPSHSRRGFRSQVPRVPPPAAVQTAGSSQQSRRPSPSVSASRGPGGGGGGLAGLTHTGHAPGPLQSLGENGGGSGLSARIGLPARSIGPVQRPQVDSGSSDAVTTF